MHGDADHVVRLRWVDVGIVAVGGAVGTGARALVTTIVAAEHVAIVTLVVNVLGAMLLGVLLESHARGEDAGRRRGMRLLLGTGALGGFTTYSALAVHTMQLGAHDPIVGLAYALGTVVAGIVAAAAGIGVARIARRWAR